MKQRHWANGKGVAQTKERLASSTKGHAPGDPTSLVHDSQLESISSKEKEPTDLRDTRLQPSGHSSGQQPKRPAGQEAPQPMTNLHPAR